MERRPGVGPKLLSMLEWTQGVSSPNFRPISSSSPLTWAPWLADYNFLIQSDADVEALLDAHMHATQWDVSLLSALFAADRITPKRYTDAFSCALGVPAAGWDIEISAAVAKRTLRGASGDIDSPVQAIWRGQPVTLICATNADPAIVRFRVTQALHASSAVMLVSGRVLSTALERAASVANLKLATHGLKKHFPDFSAGRAGPRWQPIALVALIALVVCGLIAAPVTTVAISAVLLTIPFFGTVFVRVVAMAGLLRPLGRGTRRTVQRQADNELPVYSILVALFDEAQVLPKLIAALGRLDYPAAKLDCLLIIEDVDAATKAALLHIDLPAFMRIVIVPDGEPRTKPRALNYALALARGDFVVIYDAEDRPEPDQLRRAFATFATNGPDLACVQARLNIYNVRQSWLTRQFTVEYSALFDSILPALQRLRLPMPLGGTSNHFPRAVLDELRGWDPYNVTEDADLGIRIARLGRRVTVIPSTTWEEAPATFRLWLRQRTRWLKGWMQTYLVHTRQPFRLMRDLGVVRTFGFHFYMGGLILSALVHPLFYTVVAADWMFDLRLEGAGSFLGPFVWPVATGNLVAGYLASMIVGVVAVRRRGHRLTLSALLMPFYWLLISVAAYRALWQLMRDPYRWEKTPHGLAVPDPA